MKLLNITKTFLLNNKSLLIFDYVSDIRGLIRSSIIIYPRPESHQSSVISFCLKPTYTFLFVSKNNKCFNYWTKLTIIIIQFQYYYEPHYDLFQNLHLIVAWYYLTLVFELYFVLWCYHWYMYLNCFICTISTSLLLTSSAFLVGCCRRVSLSIFFLFLSSFSCFIFFLFLFILVAIPGALLLSSFSCTVGLLSFFFIFFHVSIPGALLLSSFLCTYSRLVGFVITTCLFRKYNSFPVGFVQNAAIITPSIHT